MSTSLYRFWSIRWAAFGPRKRGLGFGARVWCVASAVLVVPAIVWTSSSILKVPIHSMYSRSNSLPWVHWGRKLSRSLQLRRQLRPPWGAWCSAALFKGMLLPIAWSTTSKVVFFRNDVVYAVKDIRGWKSVIRLHKCLGNCDILCTHSLPDI